jgi:hypothetical protein
VLPGRLAAIARRVSGRSVLRTTGKGAGKRGGQGGLNRAVEAGRSAGHGHGEPSVLVAELQRDRPELRMVESGADEMRAGRLARFGQAADERGKVLRRFRGSRRTRAVDRSGDRGRLQDGCGHLRRWERGILHRCN